MSGPADIERFPPPALEAPATPTTPGTVPQYPIPQAGVVDLVTDLASKVDENAAITAGTIPVSYDVKGLVTGGHASLAWDATNNNLKLGGAAASANSSLAILGTKTVPTVAAATVWRALDFQASTLTLTAGGVAPSELAAVRFAASVITQTAGTGYVVPVAATVTIDGAPAAGAGGGATPTLTARLSLYVKTGPVAIGNGSVLTGWVDASTAAAIYAPAKFVYVDSNFGGEWGLKFRGANSGAWGDIFGFTGNGTTGEIRCGGLYPTYFLTFYAGNVEAARITTNRNFLLGTTSDLAASRLHVKADKLVASAAGAVYDGVKFAASTLTLTGSTQCNGSLNFVSIAAPTITAAAAVTVDLAATVYISGPPVAGGSVTLTDSYSLRVASGSARFDGRILGAKGADVVAANDITLGNGNYFDLTGATEVQRILGTGWTAGSIVTLQFDANPNVKHNTAAGAGYYGFQLAGSADFAASAGDTLTLRFDGAWWREIGRTVI